MKNPNSPRRAPSTKAGRIFTRSVDLTILYSAQKIQLMLGNVGSNPTCLPAK